jgi:LmbE family N-acetylglucosaminyl deacetylase
VEATERIVRPKAKDYRGFGLTREQESRTAMLGIGVAANRLSFLGFPDEGLCRLASTYLYDKRGAFESPYTDRDQPPIGEQIIRGVRYRGVDVRREIESIVNDFKPTLLVLPHAQDYHPDHCSTHIFAKDALNAVKASVAKKASVLHYLVHYQSWPLSEDAGEGSTLKPPSNFPANQGQWVSLQLTPEEAIAKKRTLLEYRSQVQVIGRFMLAFGRDNELFIQGDPVSRSSCWCDGENIAPDPSPERSRRKP